ncbi:hypothetical protein PRIPAC_72002 [Pristionchus pacificus]|uniref:Uncharacterized protein n=1 Tax=Pristionchus pacificus TaxID=54126 RepID=A0A2A6BZD5_PRIPA|nr:hypothetical protein PRIPAC_72002 [Pristionchus pacificus]|eukprot:PDM71304.1 hypothetical protein PRIPAC_37711 [Pristionchus pacificus]
MFKVVAILLVFSLPSSLQRSTGEYIRTRCQERLECFSANCAKIEELQKCIEQAAAYIAMVMVACTESSCPKSEAEAVDKFFVSPVIFKMNHHQY